MALQRVTEIDTVVELCGFIKEMIESEAKIIESAGKKDYEPCLEKITIKVIDKAKIVNALTQWVDDEYAPIDERIEITRRKKVRRYDSLSRILSSQSPSISVCSAVTIDTTGGLPRLIIGANLSSTSDDSVFIKELADKLTHLMEFYTRYALGYKTFPEKEQCEALAVELHQKLFPRSPVYTQGRPTLLMQAVYKLTHALLFDSTTLADEEKQAFLNRSIPLVLLPTVVNGRVEMQINYLTLRGKIQSTHPLKHNIPGNELRYVHAEQLIATYLYEINSSPQKPYLLLVSQNFVVQPAVGF